MNIAILIAIRGLLHGACFFHRVTGVNAWSRRNHFIRAFWPSADYFSYVYPPFEPSSSPLLHRVLNWSAGESNTTSHSSTASPQGFHLATRLTCFRSLRQQRLGRIIRYSRRAPDTSHALNNIKPDEVRVVNDTCPTRALFLWSSIIITFQSLSLLTSMYNGPHSAQHWGRLGGSERHCVLEYWH
jgi:hypothetical protein